ncbi:hypothetical protein BgiBS90_030324, partial [Biomphalaria glabrata]
TYLQCYIPERKHPNEPKGNITIQIDGFVQTKGFKFKPDPIVKAVHPASTLMRYCLQLFVNKIVTATSCLR